MLNYYMFCFFLFIGYFRKDKGVGGEVFFIVWNGFGVFKIKERVVWWEIGRRCMRVI